MFAYIARRLLAAVLVVFLASFIVYVLAAYSGDPLEELRLSTDPNREQHIQQRIDRLQLDIPPVLRYFSWLGGILGFFVGEGSFGVNIQGMDVGNELARNLGATITLVTAATVLAIVLGIAIGMTAALRQYSGYDYTITFMMFVFYSLPVFWVAVLLKEFLAIGFNDFLQNPDIPIPIIVILALLSGIVFMSVFGGTLRTRAIVFFSATLSTAGILVYFNLTQWFLNPGMGPVMVAFIALGAAIVITLLSTGLKNRRALYTAIGVALLAPILHNAMMWVFFFWPNGWMLLIYFALWIAVPAVAGWFLGGEDKRSVSRTAGIMGFIVGLLLVLDRFFEAWGVYRQDPRVNNRPISTSGAFTPNLEGSMWIHMVDGFTHLLLPTLALLLISLAAYTRYSRASLLEVMNQDYVRTARAKGLPERTVVMRHAFRNALIPIATIIAFDIGGLIGGAIITERIFGWNGMGRMFLDNLDRMDLNPVMAVFLVTGLVAIVFNLIADLTYAALDPRIRVK